jgi:hypothetical protein
MIVDGHDGERYDTEKVPFRQLVELRQATQKAVDRNDLPGRRYWQDELDEIAAEIDYRVRHALDQLNKEQIIPHNAVSLLTGYTHDELDELGGF